LNNQFPDQNVVEIEHQTEGQPHAAMHGPEEYKP
jgi:hypothetical protein